MKTPWYILTSSLLVLALAAPAAVQQTSTDPFTAPIEATEGVIAVDWVELATVPDANGEPPRLMHLVDDAGARRLLVSTMRGMLYAVSYDGKAVTPYLNVDDPRWGIGVQFRNTEQGLQSFALHPQFAQRGAPGYGKLYTYTDTTNVTATPDFVSGGEQRTHDTVLLEWSARDAAAAAYDGGPPRELLRVAQPYGNHNGGEIAFNPLAAPGSPEFGLLYVGSADGGSGGDPLNLSQNLNSVFGKILRIDPLGRNSANRNYGVPATNPFVSDVKPQTLGEIYAYGVRNPQRLAWDARTGRMFVADIGQNQVEEVSPVTPGANLGWNVWEGSFRYVNRQVDLANPRSDASLTWPIVEYDHRDPLFQRQVAITGLFVYRQNAVPQLANRMIFGDNPSGELFHVDADALPNGGHDAIRRVLFNDGGTRKTLLQLIRDKNTAQGKPPANRADLRIGLGPGGQILLLNKRDGVIRALGSGAATSVAGRGGDGSR